MMKKAVLFFSFILLTSALLGGCIPGQSQQTPQADLEDNPTTTPETTTDGLEKELNSIKLEDESFIINE